MPELIANLKTNLFAKFHQIFYKYPPDKKKSKKIVVRQQSDLLKFIFILY